MSAAPATSARDLRERVAGLTVRVESAATVELTVIAPDYPGGRRPSSVVHLGGAGCLGSGELVSFAIHEHACLAGAAAALTWRCAPIGEMTQSLAVADVPQRHVRAALEAALIDLALKQAGLSLCELARSVPVATVRFLRSFAADPDPAHRIGSRALEAGDVRYKVDVDPSWSAAAIEALAQTGRVAVLDFKGLGDARDAERLARRFAGALLEDPPAGTAVAPERVVRDMPLDGVEPVRRAVAAGHGINVKAPRLGGVLAALAALEVAASAAGAVYFGGMFEVGIGRRQARALATLFTAAAENDLAPLHGVEPPVSGCRLAVRLDRPGFAS